MKDIETLIKLQEIDVQIFKIKKTLEQKPLEIKVLEDEFLSRVSSLKKLEDEVKQVQIKHKEKDLDLQTKEQTIDKQKAQLYQIKSNKEYNALQLEIEKEKADNSLLEEEIIIILEKIDKLKQSIATEKESTQVEENKLKQTKTDIELEIKKLTEELDVLSVQRKRIHASDIKPNVLALYERILENKGELAIVSVKDNACAGCFMEIRPQVLNELNLGKLLTCETCARILYVEQNEQTS